MMTSIWYRPYFKMAIAIATGNPASPIAVTTTSAAVVTGAQDVPPMSIDTSTTTEKPIAVAAVKAIHLICCRSSRSPDRYRTVIATVETAIRAMNTNQAWLMVPISTVDSGAGKDRTPSGFWTMAETPPGAGSCTFFGWTRNPIKVSVMSSRHKPPTGRQRGDGRCPVGKSRNMNAMPQISGTERPLGQHAHRSRGPAGCLDA